MFDESAYRTFFHQLTRHHPHGYQLKVAERLIEGRSVVLRARTGAGKTWSVLVPFFYSAWQRRPARLMYALRLRTLVARAKAVIHALASTLLKPAGAQRNTQNPHIVNCEGVVATSSTSLPAPTVSPLNDNYRDQITQAANVAGIPGPGRWLIAEYQPTALFSLKISSATSSVGKTLVVPTPYSIKMAMVDAAFRAGLPDAECADLLQLFAAIDVRVAPTDAAAVTHTFVKVRQESRGGDPLVPYIASIAYRKVAHHSGRWLWAFDLSGGDDALARRLVHLAPHVGYIGKRGSFVQFLGLSRLTELSDRFTQPVQNGEPWSPPRRAHVVPLDDFGPEADLETLSSFTNKSPKRGRHRKFVETIVPMGLVNTGPGFSEYRAE